MPAPNSSTCGHFRAVTGQRNAKSVGTPTLIVLNRTLPVSAGPLGSDDFNKALIAAVGKPYGACTLSPERPSATLGFGHSQGIGNRPGGSASPSG